MSSLKRIGSTYSSVHNNQACIRALGGYGSASGDCRLAILGAEEQQEERPGVPTHQEPVATSMKAVGCRAKVVPFNKTGEVRGTDGKWPKRVSYTLLVVLCLAVVKM